MTNHLRLLALAAATLATAALATACCVQCGEGFQEGFQEGWKEGKIQQFQEMQRALDGCEPNEHTRELGDMLTRAQDPDAASRIGIVELSDFQTALIGATQDGKITGSEFKTLKTRYDDMLRE